MSAAAAAPAGDAATQITAGAASIDASLETVQESTGVSFLERLRREHVKVHPYGEPTYWDERYENSRREHGQNYSWDWYVDPRKIRSVLEMHAGEARGAKILVLGCGNSRLSEVLYESGYRSIVSVDTSTVVVSQMQYRYRDNEGMEFLVADCMSLDTFPEQSFDVIFEKGCLDCVYCSYNSIDNALKAYSEAWRLLKAGTGRFVSISYGNAKTRAAHMQHQKWDIETSLVAYSHGITMFTAVRFPEATKKGKLKAVMKYGGLMSRNTAKDKWKPVEQKKHSTLTKHKDKISQLSLQGIKLLTPEEEKDLELDPNQGFKIEDVKDELEKGLEANIEAEKKAKQEHLQEAEEIVAEKLTKEIDDQTDESDLGAVLKKAISTKKEAQTEGEDGEENPSRKKRASAVWGLAKKSLAATKGVVMEGDNDDEIIDESEFEKWQK